MKVKAKDLRLADVIVLNSVMAWNRATVNKITPSEYEPEHGPPSYSSIRIYRPYVMTADFSYTDGVICYIGIEEFSFEPNPDEEFEVLERKGLK